MNKEVMDDINDGEKRCPVIGHASRHTGAMGTSANQHWWPNRLNLNILHQNSVLSSPMAKTFDYAKEFKALDLDAVIADLHALMTDSQDWWPADYGHYGPFFIRMAWHSAGTYRIGDGRGGACSGSMRFAPLNSWPDNVNLDKARMLLWPIKQKYGKKLSWADLMILTGNVALESMGFETFGFAGGRADVWEPEEDIYWGPEGEWLADQRYSAERELEGNLGAVQMGLIYVNPEGPNGEPNPLKSAFDIRDTFGRMAMNDEETVALIAGGHTFGKTHGAADAGKYVGPEPEGAGLTSQGLGWSNSFGSGKGEHAIGSGLEGAWTDNPIQWDNNYFDNLYGYEWEVRKGPGGGWQWYPVDGGGKDAFPDAHNPDKRHTPMMFTSDLALREDPAYNKISKRFHENPDQFADAFAKAWYKLTHRDMGPIECYLGPLVPKETQLWQDPVPALDYGLIDDGDIAALKSKILATGLSTSQLVSAAWASASTFRQSDRRGGATGARIRLAPQKDWAINKQAGVAVTISALEGIQAGFNGAQSGNKRVSVSDLIVLAGCAAVEDAASKAGLTLSVPFTPGRTDALQEQTDIESFAVLEPKSDGFRNYDQSSDPRSAEEQLIDRAQLLGLTAPEMTVLIGGMRALGTNVDGSNTGIFTNRPGMLTTDFFSTVLSMDYKWDEVSGSGDTFEGSLRNTGDAKWTASRIDLLFASNSQLRALAEVYASTGDAQDFADSFAAAWAKVMDADRFDLA